MSTELGTQLSGVPEGVQEQAAMALESNLRLLTSETSRIARERGLQAWKHTCHFALGPLCLAVCPHFVLAFSLHWLPAITPH